METFFSFYNVNQSDYIVKSRVFKLGPVQGPGFDRVARD
jgi:hypothetical protein